MEIIFWVAYALIGVFAGLASGLLGVSGGIITVPCLLYLFKYHAHFPREYLMHIAIGTSLAAMVFNALSSSYSYKKRGLIEWNLVHHVVFYVVIGSLFGGLIADFLPTDFLKKVFALCLFPICVLLIKNRPQVAIHTLDLTKKLPIAAGLISLISTILGIGGGVIALPLFLHWGMPEKKALGTSSLLSLIVTTVGAISYLVMGLFTIHQRQFIGFIYLPAFFIISIISFFCAPYAVKIAVRLPPVILRRGFASLLFLLSLKMLFS